MKRLIIFLLTSVLLLVAFGALAQPPPAITADQAILLCEKGAIVPPSALMLGAILAQLEVEKGSTMKKGSSLRSLGPILVQTDFKNFGRVSIAELDQSYGYGALLSNVLAGQEMIATAYMVFGKSNTL